jgi:hypothetical protein
MPLFEFFWTDEIVQHLAENDVTPEDFERIVNFPDRRGTSRSSGRRCCWGQTMDGRLLICIYEKLDELTVLPVTAYAVT